MHSNDITKTEVSIQVCKEKEDHKMKEIESQETHNLSSQLENMYLNPSPPHSIRSHFDLKSNSMENLTTPQPTHTITNHPNQDIVLKVESPSKKATNQPIENVKKTQASRTLEHSVDEEKVFKIKSKKITKRSNDAPKRTDNEKTSQINDVVDINNHRNHITKVDIDKNADTDKYKVIISKPQNPKLLSKEPLFDSHHHLLKSRFFGIFSFSCSNLNIVICSFLQLFNVYIFVYKFLHEY